YVDPDPVAARGVAPTKRLAPARPGALRSAPLNPRRRPRRSLPRPTPPTRPGRPSHPRPMGARRLILLAAFVLAAFVLAAFAAEGARAQPGLGAVQDTLRIEEGQPLRLRPNVIPGSEALTLTRTSLVPRPLGPDEYRLDYRTGPLDLRLTTPPDSGAVLIARYRVLDLGLQAVYARRRVAEAEEDTAGMLRVIEVETPGVEA